MAEAAISAERSTGSIGLTLSYETGGGARAEPYRRLMKVAVIATAEQARAEPYREGKREG
jgi:hypothetical protein